MMNASLRQMPGAADSFNRMTDVIFQMANIERKGNVNVFTADFTDMTDIGMEKFPSV